MEEIRPLIDSATPEERQALADILKAEEPTADSIFNAFWRRCQSVLGWGIMEDRPSYKEIVHQVAGKLQIPFDSDSDVEAVEIEIMQKVWNTIWEKMTPEQQAELKAQMQKTADEFDKNGALAGSAGSVGALTAAQLSGFGVYLLASTTLGALTGAVGIALPFAVYTTMSSAISLIIGPVGWLGIILFFTWKLTGANYNRLTQAVIYILALREKQRGGFA